MRFLHTAKAQFSLKAGLHALWWTVVAASFIVSLDSYMRGWGFYDAACGGSICNYFFYMNEPQLSQLASIGITPVLYSGVTVALLALHNLSSWAIGLLLYRYGWKDPFCVTASLLLIAVGIYFNADTTTGDFFVVNMLYTVLNVIGSIYVVFLFLIPDGRFVPRWTVIPAALYLVESVVRLFPPIHPYLDWPYWLHHVCFLSLNILVLYAQAKRYAKEASPEKRRQLRWLMTGLSLYSVVSLLIPLPLFNEHGIWRLIVQNIMYASLLILPFSVGVIVLEARIRHMSAAFNRTMVYLVLSVFGVMAYVLIVGTLGVLVQGETQTFVALLATGLIAVMFHPLRELVQREANRLVYGEREDPYAVLSKLTEQLETSLTHRSLLPAVVAKIASALRLPFVAIDVYGSESIERLAAYGEPGPHTSTLELEVRGVPVGRLVLGVERLHNAIPPDKRFLADDLVRQVSIAVQTVRLTGDLQRSRERLITAREEERRRLRRDLHDGLGSSLATMALRLEDTVQSQEELPERSRKALETIQLQMRESIADIRRLVYSLRPPALDEFGFAFALKELILQYETSSLQIVLEGAEREMDLSAAAEVAVYRIVQESLTNVARHAQASRCLIRLWKEEGHLNIQIADNGRGMPADLTPGVGVRSIRERAEELGGTMALHSASGQGTDIRVRLPVEERRKKDDNYGEGSFTNFAG